jgi:hypothetical protein
MGMSYILITDKETTCTGRFPYQLGYFFEAIGGYGEKSEVVQVSQLLNVDLNTFQHYDYGEDDPAIEKTFWKDVSHYEQVIHTLIDSINAHPDYHIHLKYDPKPWPGVVHSLDSIKPGDTDRLKKVLADYEQNPASLYPADSGYLREGRILNDLNDLLKTLNCFRSQGVKQIKLLYI